MHGRLEPHVDFDFDEVDRGNQLAAELCEAAPKKEGDAVTLGKIFALLLTYGGTNPQQFFVTANVLAFVLGLHPNQGASGEEIAAGLHMEKAAWSRRVNIMRKHLETRGAILPRIAGEWSKGARQSIKQTTTKHHEQRTATDTTRRGTVNRLGASHHGAGTGN